MKKQWIVGALVAATGLQTSVPADAQNQQAAGAILGAIAGGAVGSQIGGGNGKTAATIAGAIAGSVIGSKVGRSMDEADRRAYLAAQRECFEQSGPSSRQWRGGSRTNAYGTFRTGRVGRHYRTQQICREYSSSIHINGTVENTSGIACSNSDGSFYEVTSTEVNFNGTTTTTSSRYEENSFARPGYSQNYSDSRRTSERERARRERERERDRRERERDGRYDDEDEVDNGRYPVPPVGSRYPTPPGPVQGPQYPGSQYPGSQYPGQPGYGIPSMQGTMQINVTRLSGGAYYRLTLNRPMALSSIQLQIQGAGMRIYDAAVITEANQATVGQRLQVPELLVGRVMTSREGAAGFINRTERVVAIDIRAEAFHGRSDLVVILRSREGVPDFRMSVLGQSRYY